MKNSNDTIGNRTRDLPACSALPQPTEPPQLVEALEVLINTTVVENVFCIYSFASMLLK